MLFNDNTNYVIDPLLSGLADEWFWSFGDGGIDSVQDPSHLYLSPQVYAVTLTVTDSYGCVDDTTQDVEVWLLPAVGFTVAETCITFPSFFDNSGTPSPGAVTWIWNFGDNIIDTSFVPDISHTYTSADTFTVILTIIDTNGWLKLGMNYKLEVIISFLNRSFTSVQIETLGG